MTMQATALGGAVRVAADGDWRQSRARVGDRQQEEDQQMEHAHDHYGRYRQRESHTPKTRRRPRPQRQPWWQAALGIVAVSWLCVACVLPVFASVAHAAATTEGTTATTTTANTTTTTIDSELVSEEQHAIDSQVLLLLILLLFLTTLVIWRFKVKRYLFLHETGVSLIIGLIAGFLLDLATKSNQPGHSHDALCNRDAQPSTPMQPKVETVEDEAVFDPEVFFYVLLPPIIFFAGYDLKQKHFFRNLGVILLFTFIGTTIVCFVTGALVLFYSKYIATTPLTTNDCFLFGAIISATDPVTVLAIFHDLHVDNRLYAMVFGESVLNDAVAIVLFRSIGEYKPELNNELTVGSFFYSVWVFLLIFFGSLACGMVLAMASSILFKYSGIKRYPLLETALFVMLSYTAFLMGEGFGLSGIVSILFCGIGQAHYTFPCLSDESKQRTVNVFQLLNFLAENFVFAYVGLNFFTFKCHKWNAGFIAWAVFAVLASRLLHVFPLSWVANKLRRKASQKIPFNFQAMLWWAGLRGAVAVALAMQNTSSAAHQTILSTTLVIVLITVLVLGGSSEAVLRALKVPMHVADSSSSDAQSPPRQSKPIKGWLAAAWQGIDGKYIRPVLSVAPSNMEGTRNWSEVKATVADFFAGRSNQLRELSSPVLEMERGEDYDDDGGAGDDSSLDGYNPELPPQDGDVGALSGDFTSFATWHDNLSDEKSTTSTA